MSANHLHHKQLPSDREFNLLAQQTTPSVSPGMEVGSGSSGSLLRTEPFSFESNLSRESFWARIVNKGPNGEEDYEDARYWVREVWLIANLDDRAEWVTEPRSDPPSQRRWVTATNVQEVYQLDHEAESHALEVSASDDPNIGALIQVGVDLEPPKSHNGLPRSAWKARYLFSRSVPTTGWCVIRTAPDPGARGLEVQRVIPKLDGTFEAIGPLQVVHCHPNTRGRHFIGLDSQNPDVNDPEVNILEMKRLYHNWYVLPLFRLTLEVINELRRYRISDCGARMFPI